MIKNLNDRHPAQQYRDQWAAMGIDETCQLLTYHNRIIVRGGGAEENFAVLAYSTHRPDEDIDECSATLLLARHDQ